MKPKIASLLLCLILAACTPALQTPTDPQLTLERDLGDEFEIVLESDLGTGHHWELVGGLDRKRVDLLSRYYQSASDPGPAGGQGMEIFLFRAAGVGETEITLGYYPPGATQPEATRTFTVDVEVD